MLCFQRLLILFIEPSGGASGQASDIAIHAKEILRVRQLLTGIYQRHCGKAGEAEAEGLKRFGTCHVTLNSIRHKLIFLCASVETALERDYFMTGSSSFCSISAVLSLKPGCSSRGSRFRYCRWYFREATEDRRCRAGVFLKVLRATIANAMNSLFCYREAVV